jgi:hypothetical protein
VIACGSASVTAPTVEVQQPTPMATATPGAAGDPGVTVANVVTACREKNSERLQSLISVPVSGQDIQRMWAGGSDVQLLTQTIPDAGAGLVTIDVSLRVTNADGETTVQRTWDLVRGSDAVWRLTALPACY